MVKFPREPVILCMTRATLFFKLTLVNVLMTIYALFCLCLISLVLMALFTLCALMFPNQWKFRLFVMIECGFFPVRSIVTFRAIIPQFILMGIVLLVTIIATVRQRLVFPIYMTFLTGGL